MTDMVFRMAPHLLSSTELKFGDFTDNPMRCFQAIDRQCDEVALYRCQESCPCDPLIQQNNDGVDRGQSRT